MDRLQKKNDDDWLVDDMLKEVKSPFTVEIMEACFLPRFKMPEGMHYQGITDVG